MTASNEYDFIVIGGGPACQGAHFFMVSELVIGGAFLGCPEKDSRPLQTVEPLKSQVSRYRYSR